MHFHANPIQLVLSEGASAPVQVQLLRVGKFSHPMYGDFEITKQVLSELVKNFELNVRKVDCAIDFSHDSDKEAAAWITELILLNDGDSLHAKVKWTPRGQKAIENKEYRYLSADFAFKYTDSETQENFGPTLFGAGLTNRPFVKGMSPAVELEETKGDIKMTLQESQAENTKLSEQVATLLTEKKTLEEKTVTLEGEVKKLSDEKVVAQKEAVFAKLLSEGKACVAQKDAFMSGDMLKFAELTEKVNVETKGEPEVIPETKPDEKGSAQDQIVALAEKLVADKVVGTIEEAQIVVLKDPKHAELVKKYTEQSI